MEKPELSGCLGIYTYPTMSALTRKQAPVVRTTLVCAPNELVLVLLLDPFRLSDQSSLAFKLFPDAFPYSIIITLISRSFGSLRLVTVLTLVLSFHLLRSIDRDVFYIVPINSCNQAYSPLIYSILSRYILYFPVTIHSFSSFLFFSFPFPHSFYPISSLSYPHYGNTATQARESVVSRICLG